MGDKELNYRLKGPLKKKALQMKFTEEVHPVKSMPKLDGTRKVTSNLNPTGASNLDNKRKLAAAAAALLQNGDLDTESYKMLDNFINTQQLKKPKMALTNGHAPPAAVPAGPP